MVLSTVLETLKNVIKIMASEYSRVHKTPVDRFVRWADKIGEIPVALYEAGYATWTELK